jgi:hypothetical protein
VKVEYDPGDLTLPRTPLDHILPVRFAEGMPRTLGTAAKFGARGLFGGTVCGAVLSVIAAVAYPVDMLGTMLAAALVAGPIDAFVNLSKEARLNRRLAMSDAETRARSLIRDASEPEWHAIIAIMANDDPAVAEARTKMIARLAAVSMKCDEAQRYAKAEPASNAVALETAKKAARRICAQTVAEIDRIHLAMHGIDPVTRLEMSCQDIVEGASAPETGMDVRYVGRAHVARIVANAERALKLDPDLVDDTGARIDDLVRRHVPRLLQRHADATMMADVSALEVIDRDLDEGVEHVRVSVEEALSRLQGDHRQALQTEIGFLRLRRGNDIRLMQGLDLQ